MHVSWTLIVKTYLISFSLITLVACHSHTSVPMDPPWIPSGVDVDIISVSQFQLDHHGNVGQIGGAVQINADEAVSVLRLLSSLSDSYVDMLETRSPQECSIAINGKERMLALARIGADWIAFVDDHHRAPDGYSLVVRFRALNAGERSALAHVCNVTHNNT